MNKILKAALPAAIALGLAACGGSSNDDDTVSLTLEQTNLEALGDDFDYEGWIVVDGTPVSTGTFDIVNGITEPSSFRVSREDAEAADTFVLTIEPTVDDPAEPSATKILAGPITDGISNIVTDHPAAFASDFTDAAGTFILATPSNGNETPTRGIWYLQGTDDGPAASLTLPTLPEGWAYEGWVVGDGGPVSTGTFLGANGADSDGAGPTAGPEPTPPFPGQDFITDVPVVNLVGQTSVISVEPVPDNSPAPFSMKPLASEIAASDNVLDNISADNLPSGTVTINF